VYAPQGVIFLGIEQNLSGSSTQAVPYLSQFGWTFPNGFNNTGGNGDLFTKYGTPRHNYFVIDHEGRIVHRTNSSTSYNPESWSAIKPGLVAAIEGALAVPVETTTWSRVKHLYH